MNNNQIQLTKNGKAKLEAELDRRKNVERDRIKLAIKEAREQGDLSENADYASAREEQAANEARITELETTLKHVVIIEAIEIKVEFYLPNNKTKVESYEICGSESNPFDHVISNESPLAKAALAHNPGEVFTMTTESGKDVRVKLISLNR